MTTEQDVKHRLPITISVLLAAIMTSLDTTIANVALPHMQGSVSASIDQITWVLTSYLVAAAVMTPLSGWLAGRFGRKRTFMVSIVGFTMASMLCGLATSVPEIVLFRVLQGICGASLVPLSQSILLDINPREKHGQAMAIWGAGTLVGPILGPLLGGYLTDSLSWRWCFYINLPVGILAFLGVFLFISADRDKLVRRFDFLGFGMLALFVACIQLLLDRGPGQDWFHSREIWTEAILAAVGLWVFIIHTLTAEHPFFDRGLIRDRSFVSATGFGFMLGLLLFSTLALLPPMLQGLMGYSVLYSGIVSMPRGLGSFIAMLLAGQLVARMDLRLVVLMGLGMTAIAMLQMMHFDLGMTETPLVTSGIIQGLGLGLLFVPLSTLAFATLPQHLRPEGSTVYNLIRSLGGSVGISVMNGLAVANAQTMHGSLAAKVVTSDPVVRAGLPAFFNPSTTGGLMALNAEITRQATMIAYLDDFKLMFFITIACIPLLLLLRKPGRSGGDPVHAVVE